MFRIRRIFDDVAPTNRHAVAQVKAILRSQFEALCRQKIDRIPDTLRRPLAYGFRSVLYVAEDAHSTVLALALLNHDAELNFAFLDYLASARRISGRGMGGALYARVRAEALSMGAIGLFFECLPDDPALCRDPEILHQNQSRLRFYESYGARPVLHTAYETPVLDGGDNPPYLVCDGLGQGTTLRRRRLQRIIRAILERKYSETCTAEYVQRVVDSVRDDPIQFRAPRYARPTAVRGKGIANEARLDRIALIVTDQHEIHHVRDRGYVEAPVRIRRIRTALETTEIFDEVPPSAFAESWITAVHDPAYFRYFKRVSRRTPSTTPLYPYVFPVRNRSRPPTELPVRAGYYCMDTFTPISLHAFSAARRAVDCALTGAREVLNGRRAAYVLIRPPGHHAEREFFGGFCYFNNAAIAAQYLSRSGKVAILDIDYHHGNGQQEIFYARRDVLTVSLHGHPHIAYPYFSGFADEKGCGDGVGFNVNLPLPEKTSPATYIRTLHAALGRIRTFEPSFLVICLGLDTARGDPTGTWDLRGDDFDAIGRAIGVLPYPCLFIQEGGYNSRSLGANARRLFLGFAAVRQREVGGTAPCRP